MGYRSAARGEITVEPAIPFDEAHESKFGVQGYNGETSLMFEDWDIYDDFINIIPRWEDEFKAYWIEAELREIVQKWGEGRTFKGYIEIQGEGDGVGSLDLWRLMVKDGTVVTVKAEIVWPEG